MRNALFGLCLLMTSAQAQTDFSTWLRDFEQEARARGITQATLDNALGDVHIAPRVVELDRKQPEFVETFATYLERRVTPFQIARGQALLSAHQALFDEAEKRYGVPRQILAAFWGLETNYGSTMGTTSIPAALATLAFDGRRSAFFRAQLLDTLAILEAGNVAAADMKGSWAGAMGQMQFMPSTYRRYAVDGDNDSRINLWSSLPDALFSAANYLNQSGWKTGEPAALAVRLPVDFEWRYARLYYRRPITEWQAAGVVQANGAALPSQTGRAAIILPQGARGPAYMVWDNFDVILQWNRSISYALAVAILSEQFLGATPLPRSELSASVSRSQLTRLQQQLTEIGFDVGVIDGLSGSKTESAIRRYQVTQRLPEDGYASPALLQHVQQTYETARQAGKLVSSLAKPTFSDPTP
jgi:membrane-bound lytic murein transglycosylase B